MKHGGLWLTRGLLLISALALMVAAGLGTRQAQSQVPPAAEYSWDVAPIGLLADARLQDAIGQLVDSAEVMRAAGVAGSLKYAGTPPSPRPDQVSLLFAAAGFDQPAAQLGQQRRCRVWIDAPALDTRQATAVRSSFSLSVANGLNTLGLRMEPCDVASTSAEADFVIWPSAQPSPQPPNQFRSEEAGFLFALPRSVAPAGVPGTVTPPITGDGGMLRASGH